ncbi:MAG: IS21 family transposase, partial [Bacteroidota bacterium]
SKWIMYYEIHRMYREDYSVSKISRELLLNRRTVSSYLSMSESQYELLLINQSERKKELQPYEVFVKTRLEKHQDTSASQMHDWLKEKYSDFPYTSPKTVYNFVMWVRQKYNLPKISPGREYMIVEELPYGQQAQVDFGEYNLRDVNGKRVKVWFFVMVLSRSRFKYVWFSEHPFTSELAILAHEKAFGCFGGIPDEIVYDQDKVFIVDENKGDLILTDGFRAYTKERSFQLHFCRKSDPESKGKIENAVKYVKQNFLYNRPFYTIETLNDDVQGWLSRTANAMPHNRTMKPPYDEWILEKPFLNPYTEFILKPLQTAHTVRKDNAISWKGNFYVLPLGTYKGQGTQVNVKTENGEIILSHLSGNELCRHTISSGKGQVVSNTDLRRDKLGSIEELMQKVSQLFDDPRQAMPFLRGIHGEKPRYMRDQLTSIRHTIEKHDKQAINEALGFCRQNSIYSAIDFKTVVEQKTRNKTTLTEPVIVRLNPLTGSLSPNATTKPATSKITEYQSLMQKKN